jgi:hypothetical protein
MQSVRVRVCACEVVAGAMADVRGEPRQRARELRKLTRGSRQRVEAPLCVQDYSSNIFTHQVDVVVRDV